MTDLKGDFIFVRRLAQAIIEDAKAFDDYERCEPCPLSRGNARSIIAFAELIETTMSAHAGKD